MSPSPPDPRLTICQVMPSEWELPAEKWPLVDAVFERMLDSPDPMSVLVQEADPEVAEAARRLWTNHRKAAAKDFLGEPVTLVRDLKVRANPCFAAGQVLSQRFTIQRLLGSGGMGEVYLAQDGRLHEPVAIKTIRGELAADPAVRRRFLAEVQNLRRVTHPNVCRINELFDEGDNPFLSMEYLDGIVLSEWLRTRSPQPSQARPVALQLAEGLAAAHRSGIVHCDFKPANVIVVEGPSELRAVITDFGLARAFYAPGGRSEIDGAGARDKPGSAAQASFKAGTAPYMAPELLAGAAPTVRSDIYAFGKVLGELLPGDRLAYRCTALNPEDRPASLDHIIRDLRGGSNRRMFLMGGAVLAAGLAGYQFRPRPRLLLNGRQRLALNGFRPSESALANTVRDLLIMALRQSPRVMVVADDRLRSLLRLRQLPPVLPTGRDQLDSVIGREAVLLIEGTLQTAGKGLRLLVQVFEPGTAKSAMTFSQQVDDARQVVRLADQTSLRLRREFGESAASLKTGTGYLPLEQVVSSFPEAVEAYYNSLREYEAARSEPALAWLDQAIRLDPEFALAHRQRGLVLSAHFQWKSSIEAYQRASALRSRVTDRDRIWIECGYASIIGDNVKALAAAQRLAVLFPEEAIFQRTVAFSLVRIGRPRDALPYSQRAVDLDSSSDNNLSEQIANHTNANLCDEALALFQRFRQDGHSSTLLNWGAGLAYAGKEDYERAYALFSEMTASPERDRWGRMLRCGPQILAGHFVEASSALASDLAYDIVTGEQTRRQTRRVWLGMLEVDHGRSRARPRAGGRTRAPGCVAGLAAPLARGCRAGARAGRSRIGRTGSRQLTVHRRRVSIHPHSGSTRTHRGRDLRRTGRHERRSPPGRSARLA